MNTQSRDDIAAFLRSTGLSRPEIARRLHVSKAAVDSWLLSASAKFSPKQMSESTWQLAKIVFGHPDSLYVPKSKNNLV